MSDRTDQHFTENRGLALTLHPWMERMAVLSLFLFPVVAYTSKEGGGVFITLAFITGLYYLVVKGLRPVSFSLMFFILFCLFQVLSISLVEIDFTKRAIFKVLYDMGAIGIILVLRECLPKLKDSKRGARWFLNLLLWVTTIANINGIIGLIIGYNPLRFDVAEPMRAMGMFKMAIRYGYGIQFFCLFVLFLIIHYEKFSSYINKKLLYMAAFWSLLGLYLSYSRGALIGFLLGVPFLMLFKCPRLVKWGCMGIATVIVAAVIGIYATGGTNVPNERLFQGFNSESNMMRISQYQAAWRSFLDKPLWGVGRGHFRVRSMGIKEKYGIPYPEYSSHAHNNYLQVLAEVGIFGFICFILFHIFWLKESWQRQDVFRSFFTAFFVAMAVSGLFQCTFVDYETACIILFVFALSQVDLTSLLQEKKAL